MKRKSSSVKKLNNNLLQDKKILNLYLKLNEVLINNKIDKSFAVAVSGGPDSMALAGLSSILAVQKNYNVFFILVDHGIRKNSSSEAKKVKKLLQKNNIQLNVLKNKTVITKNIQKNAREVRYELLSKFCFGFS